MRIERATEVKANTEHFEGYWSVSTPFYVTDTAVTIAAIRTASPWKRDFFCRPLAARC
jgi:hypothetical protein